MKRSGSLDALRGISILLMVLSGSIAFGGILPAWMYHAQVPPPAHVFKPEIAGITWVDLVFPFFLFSMGAAIPLSLNSRISRGESTGHILLHIVSRFFFLAFFSIFTMHARSWVMAEQPGAREYILSVICYFLLFLIYTRWKRWQLQIKVVSVAFALAILFIYPFKQGFNPGNNDVIILVLANMALFGSVIWLVTKDSPLIRIGILPFVMAVFLASEKDGSINYLIFNLTPVSWLYKFYYLKYLFILLPGTLAGDWMLKVQTGDNKDNKNNKSVYGFLTSALLLAVIVSNIVCLYTRWLFLNLALSITFCGLLMLLFRKPRLFNAGHLHKKFLNAGVYLLMLGLFFEAYENGIKKDFSTYSYYFVSSGLAFILLLVLIVLEEVKGISVVIRWLSDNGKNPMIAYTTGNLLLIPLLRLTHTEMWLDSLNSNALTGFMRGAIFTSVVSVITVFCTKKKLFWRT